jgi:hypothetical protein
LGFACCVLAALAFPCFVSGLLALPLCGAALTFFAAAKKVSKESGLQPLAFKRVSWLGGGSGASGVCVFAHSAFVTRQSFFRRRFARRSGRSPVVCLSCLGASRGRGIAPRQKRLYLVVAHPTAPIKPAVWGQALPASTKCKAGSMTALSRERSAREHRFQMHHSPLRARDPLKSWRLKPAFFAYFLCGGKESKCRPAQGQRE